MLLRNTLIRVVQKYERHRLKLNVIELLNRFLGQLLSEFTYKI